MSSTVDRAVLIAHLTSIGNNNDFTEDQQSLLTLAIECLDKKIHPARILNDKANSVIREMTGLDIQSLKISDIVLDIDAVTPLETLLKEATRKVVSSSNNKPCCAYFSCAQNLSSSYSYANAVDTPTCSHPSSPFGISCVHLTNDQSTCPFYKPDSYFNNYSVEDTSYKALYTRNFQGVKKVSITDVSDNLIHELSYPMTEFFESGFQSLYDEVSALIKEYHSSLTTLSSDSLLVSNESKDIEFSKSSYISTLIS